MVAATGYSAFLSTSKSPPKWTIAVLAQVLVQVSALTPGNTQLVLLGGLSFIHLSLPTGGRVGAAVRDRAALQHSLHPSLQRPVLPMLVGDFYHVIHQIVTEDLSFVVNRKFSQELFDIVQLFSYVDAFHVLFPTSVQFSGFGCGKSLPVLTAFTFPLSFSPALVSPSTSKSLLCLTTMPSSSALKWPKSPPCPRFYWKLHCVTLHDLGFRPAFAAAWEPNAATKPPDKPSLTD
jgi:hypothetical protein